MPACEIKLSQGTNALYVYHPTFMELNSYTGIEIKTVKFVHTGIYNAEWGNTQKSSLDLSMKLLEVSDCGMV